MKGRGKKSDIWKSTRSVEVTVETRGPNGEEARWSFSVSREVYALAKATRAHAERFGCDELDVQVRYAK